MAVNFQEIKVIQVYIINYLLCPILWCCS